MSEHKVFDPEQVERYESSLINPGFMVPWRSEAKYAYRQYVKSSDYDALLALYREQERLLVWLKNQVGPEKYQTLAMVAKAEIRVAYECGDLR